MPRVKRGNKRLYKRKKILKLAKGYWGTKGKLYRPAREAVMRALKYSYRDRRARKRDFRRLWIIRIRAAARLHGISYSQFINGLKKSGVDLNRKVLADIAANDAETFARLAETAKNAHTTAQRLP